jgi:serine/threonine protein kinase
MAPEQVSGESISGATDVYALGALTFHCIAGHPPFEGDNALQIAFQQVHDEPPPLPEDVPAAVRALVSRAMAKQPTDRFPDAAAFAEAARAALTAPDADVPTEVVAVAPVADTGPSTLTDLPVAADHVDRPDRRPGRRAALFAAAVVVPLLLVLTAVALVLRSPGQRHTPAPAQPGSASVPAASTTTGPAKNTGTNTKASTGPTRTTAPTGATTTAPPQTSAPTTTGPTRTSNPGGGSTAPTPASTGNPAATTNAPTVQG